MLKPVWMSAAAVALFACVALLVPSAGERAAAQSAATYVSVVELDIVPAEREKFLAAIKENGAASVKEPGCRVCYSRTRRLARWRTTANMVAKREVRAMSPIAFNAKGH